MQHNKLSYPKLKMPDKPPLSGFFYSFIYLQLLILVYNITDLKQQLNDTSNFINSVKLRFIKKVNT